MQREELLLSNKGFPFYFDDFFISVTLAKEMLITGMGVLFSDCKMSWMRRKAG